MPASCPRNVRKLVSLSPKKIPVRVVVADDAADIRMLLRFGLSQGGDIDIIGEAATGLQAIEQASEHNPEVMILDVSMPIMDGLQAAMEIKRTLPDIKIVMYSGFRAAELEEKALRAGADVYVEKDGDLDALKRSVLLCSRMGAEVS